MVTLLLLLQVYNQHKIDLVSFVFRVRVVGLGFCVRVRVRVSITGNVSPCITSIVPSIRQASQHFAIKVT